MDCLFWRKASSQLPSSDTFFATGSHTQQHAIRSSQSHPALRARTSTISIRIQRASKQVASRKSQVAQCGSQPTGQPTNQPTIQHRGESKPRSPRTLGYSCIHTWLMYFVRAHSLVKWTARHTSTHGLFGTQLTHQLQSVSSSVVAIDTPVVAIDTPVGICVIVNIKRFALLNALIFIGTTRAFETDTRQLLFLDTHFRRHVSLPSKSRRWRCI
jgi:hypothetical protein